MVNPNGSPDRKAENAEQRYADALKGLSDEQLDKVLNAFKKQNTEPHNSAEAQAEHEAASAELKENAKTHEKNQKRGGKTIAAALLAGTLLTNFGGKIANSFINNEKSQPTPEPIQDTSGVTTEESTASYYGESNPYEITIGSEERDDFGLGEYTGNEKLNSVLNQSGKQFYLPGEYNYKKSEKVTPNAVANPKEIYKFMGVDPNNPSIEDKADAIKYTTYSQGFVSSGIATLFARAGNAPEGFTKDYNANQDHVYEMEKGGEERLAHEAWLKDVFENSTFKETTINNSDLHLYGNEKDIREDGNVRGVIAKGDTKQRDVIEQVYVNPKDGSEMTFYWQEECHNLHMVAKYKTKEGKIVTVTLIPETSTTTTTNPGPTPGPKPNPGPNPGYEWGKSGDPHGEAPGYTVEYSDPVDPGSLVTWDQNENTNNGNQGYVDDNSATPGSYSDNNGYAEVVAPGATETEERLSGGEVQGGVEINGVNTVAPAGDTSRDAAGNEAQKNSGGSHTDAQQEEAYEKGDF